MTDSINRSLSRRKWLRLAAATSLASGLLAKAKTALAESKSSSAAASQGSRAPGDNSLGARTYNVRDFGAKGDGKTLDMTAVQAAIDACTKDNGGTVLVPAGTFVIGAIEVKNKSP